MVMSKRGSPKIELHIGDIKIKQVQVIQKSQGIQEK